MSEDGKAPSVRAVQSCDSCRKMKVKCEKQKPSCSGCLKRKIICHYREYQWSTKARQLDDSSEDPTNKKKLKVRHYRPKESYDNERIDFYSNTFQTPVSFSQGALTWVSILKKDRFMNIISLSHRLKSILAKEENHNSKDVSKSEFIKKWNKGLESMVVDKETTFKSTEIDLIKEIMVFLDNPKLVWTSIDKFFNSEHYLLFSCIDREEYTEKLIDLIGQPNYDSSTSITLNINSVIDLSTIGTLLIILNIVSISTYNFGKPLVFLDEETQIIIENASSTSSYKLICKIHQELSNVKNPSLQIFQFVSMKLFFEFFAPEEYDCLSIIHCGKIGELYQLAIQCSLNRDPDQQNNRSLLKDARSENLSRRLWYYVMFWDMLKFMEVGYPPIIEDSFFDTKLPLLDKSGPEDEYIINCSITERKIFYNKVKPVLKLILNIKLKPTVGKIKHELDTLLEYVNGLDSIDSLITSQSVPLRQRYSNYKKLIALIESNSLLFTIYYHLFIFYSERQSIHQSIRYLLELLKITKLLYKPLLFVDPNVTSYNLNQNFISAPLCFPKLEAGFHKTSTVFLTLLSRIKALKILKQEDIDIEVLVIIDSMLDLINSAFSYMMAQYINASDVYYHAWIQSKVQLAIAYKILNIPKGPFIPTDFTAEDLNYKQSLSETSRSQLEVDIPGDLGFENYSIEDLRKVHEELKGFREVFDYSATHPSPLRSTEMTPNNSNTSTARSPPMKKRKVHLSSETITENDKRWFERMAHEFTHVDHHNNQRINPDPEIYANNNLETSPNDLNIETLNSFINGSNLEELFDFGVDSFFG